MPSSTPPAAEKTGPLMGNDLPGTGSWALPTTPASTVTEAAERFMLAARVIRDVLVDGARAGRYAGRDGVARQFADEELLRRFNLGHLMVMGHEMPDELRLNVGEHFGPDGLKVFGRNVFR